MTGPADLPAGGVPPSEAIAFFRSKGFRIGFNWQDVFRLEHVRWFTVAKAVSRDILEDVREAVDAAIADGTTLEDFKRTLRPKLEAKGWWGRKRMIDPLTAESKVVQLGSPRRLKTIFNANLRSAYQAGKWERIERTKSAFPYLQYTSVMDGRERPQHHAWHGTLLPVDDPWWETHYGPCDWECRCSATQRSLAAIKRLGLTVTKAPVTFPQEPWVNTRTGETGTLEAGIGKGWDFNVGREYLRGLAPSPLPESFGGGTDEVGASAQLRASEVELVDRFLAAFDIAVGGEAIWMDRDGWPLSIGRGWFIGQSGAVRMPKAALLDRIAAAIVTPDAIRWVWVRAETGRMVLMRRYARTFGGFTAHVDIGGVGWRWMVGPADEIAAAFNPHRDSLGRFARSGTGSAALAMWNSADYAEHSLGVVSAANVATVKRETGMDIGGFERFINTGGVRHVKRSHGDPAVEALRNQIAVGPRDFSLIRDIVAQGGVVLQGEPNSRKPQRLEYAAVFGDRLYRYRETVGPAKKRLQLQSLRIERITK